MREYWNVVLMAGGPSAEREVSLVSGRVVGASLRTLGHQVVELDPLPGCWRLPPDTDLVFLALHGTYGEDGTIQRELDALGVPYTGCDAGASLRAFDKVRSKYAFRTDGVPTAEFEVLDAGRPPVVPEFGFPLVLKPSCQGSSVGVQVVEDPAEWEKGFSRVASLGDTVLAEPYLSGREITVGILGGEVLPSVEIRPGSGYYDYHSKYTRGSTEYICPAFFEPDLQDRIDQVALAALHAIGGGPCVRVDMIICGKDPRVLEVNTLPGMTGTSLLPRAAAAHGLSHEELCGRIASMAMERREDLESVAA